MKDYIKNSRLLVKLDANSNIGLGHLTRTLAVLEELKSFHVVIYSLDDLTNFPGINSFQFKKIAHNSSFIDEIKKNDFVLIDDYAFDENHQKLIKQKGPTLILIDDLNKGNYHADLIINQAPSIKSYQYIGKPATQYLLGLNYALLRSEFLLNANTKSKKDGAIVICFGGADPLNLTLSTLKTILENNSFSKINIVLGANYSHIETLENYINEEKFPFLHFFTALKSIEMAALMEVSEFAIVPCSGILMECIASKMKIISGYYVENQKDIYQQHLKLNSFVDAKNFASSDLKNALQQIKSFKIPTQSIDGKSIQRISKSITGLALAQECKLRKVDFSDLSLTYKWANNPEIRKYAFNTEKIPFENHEKWFNQKLNDKQCIFFILEHEGNSIGSIRFDIDEEDATISYLLDPEFHGKGFGNIILKLGIEEICKKPGNVSTIIGHVLKENLASIKIFEKFAFEKVEKEDTIIYKMHLKQRIPLI